MYSINIIYLLLLVAVGWYWLNSIRVLELARAAGRVACAKEGVQFLDDTVASIELGIARNDYGHRVLRRVYRFEFTETGNSRIEGKVVMLGEQVESVTMDPYQLQEVFDDSE